MKELTKEDMKKMSKEEWVYEIGRPILSPLGIIQLIFLLTIISSVFIWIWVSWEIAWKIGLTGFIGTIITTILYAFVKSIIREKLDKTLNKIVKS